MSASDELGPRGRGDEPEVSERAAPARPIGWTEMRQLLEQVAERLDPDIPVDMWIAGGSALASADLRLSTTDVDVVSDVPEEVYEAARDLASEIALAPGWLNASARSFLPRGATATTVLQAGPLTVRRVSHDDLFLMKLDRGLSGDVADMRVLWKHCSYVDGQAAVDDYVERHYLAPIERDPHMAKWIDDEIVGRR
jgi:hypothetical protein